MWWAQIRGTGLIAERFLGIPYDYGVFVGLGGILLCSMLGGMRAVTWTQVAQYIVLIIAYLIPVVIMSYKVTGVPIPQLMYGEALQQITALEQSKEALAGAKAHVTPYSSYTTFNFFALILCLMIGTASLPHVLMRYFTTPSVRAARKSVGWSLPVPLHLVLHGAGLCGVRQAGDLPERHRQGDWTISRPGSTSGAPMPRSTSAAWRRHRLMPSRPRAVRREPKLSGSRDFKIAKDVVVVATPEIAGLPFVITGLVGAGGLAAAMSTADGLLLAMANALSHDIYYRMIDRHAPTSRRLVVARVILFGIAIAGAFTATFAPPDILKLVAWAFSLAAAGNFPALVLGIWWERCNTQGAVAGMIAGFGATLFYLIWTAAPPLGWGLDPWFNVANISAGVFGIPIGFIVMIVVSKMTPRTVRRTAGYGRRSAYA